MEKITQQGKDVGLEKNVPENRPPETPLDTEVYKVGPQPELSDAERERVAALHEELEQLVKEEGALERSGIHIGDNNTHIDNSVNISNTINNGGNFAEKNREVPVQEEKREPSFFEKYFGKGWKGLLNIANPLVWLKILNINLAKKQYKK
jgi:hypothetical protein